jgi:hypothetical protein
VTAAAAQLARAQGWRTVELATDHYPEQLPDAQLVQLLLSLAGGDEL